LRGDQARKFPLSFFQGNLFAKKTPKSLNKIEAQGGIGTLVL
jgi:hypothetical protein